MAFPHKSLSRVPLCSTSQCCKSRAFNSSGVWVTSFPCPISKPWSFPDWAPAKRQWQMVLKVKASRNKKRCNWCNWHASTFPHLHKKKAGFTWPARSASLAFSLRSSTLSTSCFFWASTCSEVHHQNFRAVSAVSTHSVPRLLQLPRTGSFQQRSTCLLPQRLHLFSLALTCSSCSFLCQDFTQLARWGAWPQIFKATW